MAGQFYDLVGRFQDRPFLIGLDPHFPSIPDSLKQNGKRRRNPADVVLEFNRAIIDATRQECAGYKLNLAYYTAIGLQGLRVIHRTLRYIRQIAPECIAVLDGKFGDVDRTSQRYVEAFLGQDGFDSVTVTPYFGGIDSLRPFLSCANRGIFVVCRTSDKSINSLQTQRIIHSAAESKAMLDRTGLKWFELYDTIIDRWSITSVHRWIAAMVATEWNDFGNCGLVMAAQHPRDARAVRTIVGDKVPFLVPGVGTQGGEVVATVKACRNSTEGGFLLSSSSAIIHAGTGNDFDTSARLEAQKLAESISAA